MGLAGNNYYSTSAISVTFTETTMSISKSVGYGAYIVLDGWEAGEAYNIEYSATGAGFIQALFYQSSGSFIGNIRDFNQFTIPSNAAYVLIGGCTGGGEAAGTVTLTRVYKA